MVEIMDDQMDQVMNRRGMGMYSKSLIQGVNCKLSIMPISEIFAQDAKIPTYKSHKNWCNEKCIITGYI
jgi:hypothetical protein